MDGHEALVGEFIACIGFGETVVPLEKIFLLGHFGS
jgi:hypothetical protein